MILQLKYFTFFLLLQVNLLQAQSLIENTKDSTKIEDLQIKTDKEVYSFGDSISLKVYDKYSNVTDILVYSTGDCSSSQPLWRLESFESNLPDFLMDQMDCGEPFVRLRAFKTSLPQITGKFRFIFRVYESGYGLKNQPYITSNWFKVK